MTLEQVIGLSADEIEKWDDAKLKEHFSHYLLVTRPENSPKEVKKEQQVLAANPQFLKAQQLAASVGINIPTSLLTLKPRKK